MRGLTIAVLLFAGITSGCGGGGGGAGGKYGPWRVYESPGTFGVTAVWAFAPNDVWVGSNIILHYDGTAFTEVAMPTPLGFVTDFWGFAPNDLYAVSGADLLHWDGAAWSAIDYANAIDPTDLTAIWGSSGGDLWLGDSLNGRVFHWDGTAWLTGITQTVSVEDLWGVAGGPIFAGGTFGLSQWTGSSWVDGSDSVVNEATALWGFGAGDVWAASDFGTLAHWDGAVWTDTLPADNPDFEEGSNSIWGAAPNDVWAVGDGGAISHWDGASWSQIQVGRFPFYPFLNKVHGSSAGDVWAVGLSSDGRNTGVILHHEP
jgi:hypothetical protein